MEDTPCAQLHDKMFFQVGNQKAAASQKICPAESRAGRKLPVAGGKPACFNHHALTCSSMKGGHQQEAAATQGLQDVTSIGRTACINVFTAVHCFVTSQAMLLSRPLVNLVSQLALMCEIESGGHMHNTSGSIGLMLEGGSCWRLQKDTSTHRLWH